MRANLRKQDFAISTISRAVGVPLVFAFLFFVAYPPMESCSASHAQSLAPAAMVLALGVCGWFFVLWSILRGIRASVKVGSGWTAVSVLPLLAYAWALVDAFLAVRYR